MDTGNKALLDKSLVKFIENNKPTPPKRKNKLDAFKEQIFFLKDNGYSDNQIVEFLRTEKQLNTTQQAVNQFIHSRREKTTQEKKQPKPEQKTQVSVATTPKTNSIAVKPTTFVIDRTPLEELLK